MFWSSTPSLSLTPAPGVQLPSPRKPRETTHACSCRQPSWGTSGRLMLQPRYHMTATTCRPQCKPPTKPRQPQEPWQLIPERDLLLFSATRVACYAATDTGTNYVLSPLKASGGKWCRMSPRCQKPSVQSAGSPRMSCVPSQPLSLSFPKWKFGGWYQLISQCFSSKGHGPTMLYTVYRKR